MPQGKGTYASGIEYEGEWLHGDAHGHGTLVWPVEPDRSEVEGSQAGEGASAAPSSRSSRAPAKRQTYTGELRYGRPWEGILTRADGQIVRFERGERVPLELAGEEDAGAGGDAGDDDDEEAWGPEQLAAAEAEVAAALAELEAERHAAAAARAEAEELRAEEDLRAARAEVAAGKAKLEALRDRERRKRRRRILAAALPSLSVQARLLTRAAPPPSKLPPTGQRLRRPGRATTDHGRRGPRLDFPVSPAPSAPLPAAGLPGAHLSALGAAPPLPPVPTGHVSSLLPY